MEQRELREVSTQSVRPPRVSYRTLAAALTSLALHCGFLGLHFRTSEKAPSPPIELSQAPDTEVVFTEDAADPKARRPPGRARYLSHRDQSVERETRRPNAPSSARGTTSHSRSRSHVELSDIEMGDLLVESRRTAPGPARDEVSMSWDARLDDLSDVPLGSQTLLNTRQYAYYSYYERMKQKLAPIWRPEVQRRMRALWISGREPVERRLNTAVAVGVDAGGAVKFVEVVRGSGIGSIDDAAIESFFLARVFPNPPRALLNEAEELFMRWNFVVDVATLDRPDLPRAENRPRRDYR